MLLCTAEIPLTKHVLRYDCQTFVVQALPVFCIDAEALQQALGLLLWHEDTRVGITQGSEEAKQAAVGLQKIKLGVAVLSLGQACSGGVNCAQAVWPGARAVDMTCCIPLCNLSEGQLQHCDLKIEQPDSRQRLPVHSPVHSAIQVGLPVGSTASQWPIADLSGTRCRFVPRAVQ